MTAAEPILRDLGTVRRCGPVGSGAALKLVANAALVAALGALRDSLALADALRLDRSTALATLAAGPLGAALPRATATGASFSISLAAKDARLALRAAPHLPLVAAVAQLLDGAADQDADLATLIPKELP